MRVLLGISVFLLVFTAINIGMHYYSMMWLLRHFPWLAIPPRTARLLSLLLALLLPFGMWYMHQHTRFVNPATTWVFYTWMGSILVFTAVALFSDALRLILTPMLHRGDLKPFFGPAGVAVAASFIGWSLYCAAQPPMVKKMDVTLPNLPPALDGFRIAVLSDVHLSSLVHNDRLENLVSLVMEQKPDAVFMLGDFRDRGYPDADKLEQTCSRLALPPQRKLGILGNHEFYNGLDMAAATFHKCGIRLLRDEVVTLDNGIQVAGLDDLRTSGLSKSETSSILKKLDPAKPSIYLQHQPRWPELARDAGVGLMLCGHTHAGQMWPFNWIVRTSTPYVYGLYRLGGMQLYVTSGNFYWGPPMRLFARHELPIITLRSPAR